MKKLLLILLCLPMIGLGQNFHTETDYKLINIHTGEKYNLQTLIDNLQEKGFTLIRNKKGEMIRYHKLVNPYIMFSKEVSLGFGKKLIHIWERDNLDNLLIWKVENQIVKTKKNRSLVTRFQKNIVDKNYKLKESKTLYNYKTTLAEYMPYIPLDYVVNDIYTNNYKECNPLNHDNIEDGLEECNIETIVGFGKLSRDPEYDIFFQHIYIVQNIEYSTFSSKFEEIGQITIDKNDEKYQKIPINQEGDMQYVSIKIGNKSYKYLIDTGASDMTINNDMEEYLKQSGLLKSTDYIESKTYEIANGEKIQAKRAVLKSITINDIIFKNVKIAIFEDASLLLGMSFLNQFKWKIHDGVLILEKK